MFAAAVAPLAYEQEGKHFTVAEFVLARPAMPARSVGVLECWKRLFIQSSVRQYSTRNRSVRLNVSDNREGAGCAIIGGLLQSGDFGKRQLRQSTQPYLITN